MAHRHHPDRQAYVQVDDGADDGQRDEQHLGTERAALHRRRVEPAAHVDVAVGGETHDVPQREELRQLLGELGKLAPAADVVQVDVELRAPDVQQHQQVDGVGGEDADEVTRRRRLREARVRQQDAADRVAHHAGDDDTRDVVEVQFSQDVLQNVNFT